MVKGDNLDTENDMGKTVNPRWKSVEVEPANLSEEALDFLEEELIRTIVNLGRLRGRRYKVIRRVKGERNEGR